MDLARPVGEALVIEMGGDPVWVPESQRLAYHTALTHAADHLVTLVAQSMQLLGEAGIEDPARILEPLLSASLSNALQLGDVALGGPVSRGDAETVAEHVELLESEAPDVRATYVAMARATAQRAVLSGRLSAAAAEPILEALSDE
jgi:predicted short-subunit dehydrogenase-like oxidoreductase (DUF2520 family)